MTQTLFTLMQMHWSMLVGGLILLAGVVDDLRSRKVHNSLFLACAIIGLLSSIYNNGGQGFLISLLGFGSAIVFLLPFVLGKALGAGDMKILAAFGIATNWNAVLSVAIYSLFWGALFGVVRLVLQGHAQALLSNMIAILTRQKTTPTQMHSMPYTVALFFGWLTLITYEAIV